MSVLAMVTLAEKSFNGRFKQLFLHREGGNNHLSSDPNPALILTLTLTQGLTNEKAKTKSSGPNNEDSKGL